MPLDLRELSQERLVDEYGGRTQVQSPAQDILNRDASISGRERDNMGTVQVHQSVQQQLGNDRSRSSNISHIEASTQAEPSSVKFRHEDYKIGWICPLEIEQDAALYMLDEKHQRLSKKPSDKNIYTLGSINGHNVVMAGQPRSGNNHAAIVATDLRRTFPEVKFILLVGIGGGVPTAPIERNNSSRPRYARIRLGDVVVSIHDNGGAIQYDHGKAEAEGRLVRTGVLDSAPDFLISAAKELSLARKRDWVEKREDPIRENLRRINPRASEFEYPGSEYDLLFSADYQHKSKGAPCTENDESGLNCDANQVQPPPINYGLLPRRMRNATNAAGHGVQTQPDPTYVEIHRGTIASGEKVIKNAKLRDQLAAAEPLHNILCFEMEAAGALRGMPCLVIRGIADYCDSHKNDEWHGYAAATAASYARLLLSHVPVEEVTNLSISREAEEAIKFIHERSKLEVNDYRELYEWLSPLKPHQRHEDFKQRRVAGTGTSFLASTPFLNWVTSHDEALSGRSQNSSEVPTGSSSRLLVCHGGPGVGKTFLCCTVIEHLKAQEPPATVVFMYCDYNDQSSQTPLAIIGSLLWQLISDDHRPSNAPRESMIRKYQDWKENPQKFLTLEKLTASFKEALACFKRVYLCIDAVDECADKTRSSIIEFIKEFIDSSPSLSIFVTGRPGFQELLEDVAGSISPLQAGHEDLQRCIESRLAEFNKHNKYRNSMDEHRLRGRIVQRLTEVSLSESDGVVNFLLARLHLDAVLEPGLSLCEREQVLEELSSSFEKTFEGTMTRIEKQGEILVRKALRALQWITFAGAPLSKEDLETALAVDIDAEEFRPDNITDLQVILESCLGLILHEEESGTVRFFHFSVWEFFQNHHEGYFPGGEVSMSETCLTYLYQDSLTASWTSSTPSESLPVPMSSFFHYATFFWAYHLGTNGKSEVIQKLLTSVLLHYQDRRHHALIHGFSHLTDYFHSDLHDPLIDSSVSLDNFRKHFEFFDLPVGLENSIAHMVFDKETSRDALAGVLASFGCVGLFSYLHSTLLERLRRSVGRKSYLPLIYAVAYGRTHVVRLLLSTGQIDPMMLDERERTPLHFATWYSGTSDIVRILLGESVEDVDFQIEENKTHSFSFTARGSISNRKRVRAYVPMKLVNPDARDAVAGTPLLYAADQGKVEMVRLLLETGRVDPNARDGLDGTALIYAAQGGYAEIVRLFLETGRVNPETRGYGGRTALSYAAGAGSAASATVRLLLETNKVDPDAKDFNPYTGRGGGRTPLSYAAESRGSAATVRLLLETKRVDPNSKDSRGVTPLWYASQAGNTDVIELLLRYDSDPSVHPNTRDKRGRTAFSYFCDFTSLAHATWAPLRDVLSFDIGGALKFLLSMDLVDPNVRDVNGRTPLHYCVLNFKLDNLKNCNSFELKRCP
ncbi:hypothetical protein BJ508DRAFT_328893 [Ascobolus immersus RN42]|uniref:Uncharacterized protein n=1 Tax=Ascobolus immersus RN42 TaxID=1160509 RepID=A0A3N4I451_ASCIM|nr:hypothetical protein BJ508DRAFT_328893 [Ascobolus immersus RN42]